MRLCSSPKKRKINRAKANKAWVAAACVPWLAAWAASAEALPCSSSVWPSALSITADTWLYIDKRGTQGGERAKVEGGHHHACRTTICWCSWRQEHTAIGPHPAAHLSFMSVPGCVAPECCSPPCVKQQGAAAGALHACRFGRQGCSGSAAEAPQPPQAMLSYAGCLRKYCSPTAAPYIAQLQEYQQVANFATQAARACC